MPSAGGEEVLIDDFAKPVGKVPARFANRMAGGARGGASSRPGTTGAAGRPRPRSSSETREPVRRSNSGSSAPKTFSRGDAVEAKYKGRVKYQSGVIDSVNPDGSYDIRYPAAAWNKFQEEHERNVPAIRVKEASASVGRTASGTRSGSPSPSRASVTSRGMEGGDSYRVGDEVEALYKGGTKWFKGSIAEVGLRGRYAVKYADGDFEDNIPS
eukprot:CAMPEP_0119531020 /NCGR_PEP_ID=MMETSP1344-20130328/44774_1 /TAXON_ID=236787 /ORGANISM="Florenciella parvula, Strain CCMP2471" /LENGTH=212 /DNA_ID=CAMNT_0007571151 /DNA_START=170 /DNA_END=804 /DNA_ORIENTATION=+